MARAGACHKGLVRNTSFSPSRKQNIYVGWAALVGRKRCRQSAEEAGWGQVCCLLWSRKRNCVFRMAGAVWRWRKRGGWILWGHVAAGKLLLFALSAANESLVAP